MIKLASLIYNRPTLKALRHVKRNRLMEKVPYFGKVLLNVETKDITGLNDAILTCSITITKIFNRAK